MLKILVVNRSERVEFEHESGPLELGRNDKVSPFYHKIKDLTVSGEQLRAEEVDGRIQFENLSKRVPVRFADGSKLLPGETCEKALPCRLTIGESLVDFEIAFGGTEQFILKTVTPPIRTLVGPQSQDLSLSRLGDTPSAEDIARWLERLVSVQLAAAGASDFYQVTARAVVELIGLDYGTVLLREPDNNWRIVAKHGNKPAGAANVSRTILKQVVAEKCTYYQVLPENTVIRSLIGGSAVVAAPVMAPDGQSVLGAVYGVRVPSLEIARSAIRPLDAQLVQVLACAVGAGLARIKREEEAAHHRKVFGEFVSEEVANALERDPRLLEGKRREITILFCDIRNFSRISENLDPEDTCALIRDVMERLTERIREHQGVVVDYIGDALLALWNAPSDQPNHAVQACEAALAMLEELPAINRTWSGRINGNLGLGIGINTGQALVGNTGSHTRSKYGPLGHAVNLASRIEGATKQFGLPILLTEFTREKIRSAGFSTRRLCQLQVLGIEAPVRVYELHGNSVDPAWNEWRNTYESGLDKFEHGDLAQACKILHSLMEDRNGEYDKASLYIVSRALDFLKEPEKVFDPVLKLQTK